jgi:hypothetical protein
MSVGMPDEKTEGYSEDDRKLLVSLLNEYTEKLSTICDKLDKSMGEQDFNWFNSLLSSICLISFVFLIWLNRISLYSPPGQYSLLSQFLLLASVCVIIFLLSFLALNLVKISRVSLQIKKSFRDARVLDKRLEKVTQIVSQIEEHSVRKLSSRIEMDLRLADAEIVLEYYRVLSNRLSGVELFLNSAIPSVKFLR